MPLDDYYCPTCHALYEIWVPIRDLGKPVTCPEDHAVLEKQLAAPAIQVRS